MKFMKIIFERFLEKFLCKHSWNLIEEWGGKRDGIQVMIKKEYHCSKCGKIKIVTI